MNIEEFASEKLNIIRIRLSELNYIDDNIAKDVIIKTVFDDERAGEFKSVDIDNMIDSLFYKTRRRLGIIQPLIEDDNISEIMVNGPNNIFYEKNGKIIRYNMTFDSSEELEEVMQAIAGDVHREINEMNPIVDARLADGSRVNGVYKNIAVNGPILTIRKFSEKHITMDDMVRLGTLTEEAKIVLTTLVACGYNIFISGGTSSGKTTFLNALAESIPSEERVIVIEDSMELKLDYIENIVHMECRNANSKGQGKINMADLIKSSLRMRPNRIIVGEVRGGEVVEMLSAMNTGHQGSMSTGHGNSVTGMIKRLESMYLMAVPMSVDAIRSQIVEGIDIMVHLEKQSSGKRKVAEISEIVDYEKEKYVINTLYRMNEEEKLMRVEGSTLNNQRRIFLKGKEYVHRLQEIGIIIGPKGRLYNSGSDFGLLSGEPVL